MPCPRTQPRNIVPILRGEEHDISLKNSALSGVQHRTTVSDISKALRSNHSVTSLYNVHIAKPQTTRWCYKSRLLCIWPGLNWAYSYLYCNNVYPHIYIYIYIYIYVCQNVFIYSYNYHNNSINNISTLEAPDENNLWYTVSNVKIRP